MNAANAEALANLYRAWLAYLVAQPPRTRYVSTAEVADEFGKWAAERGVLVPSVLAGEDGRKAWEAAADEEYDDEERFAGFSYADYRGGLCPVLERIARGEPA